MMPFEFFQIPTATPGAVADTLNQFLKTHRIINVEKHFFTDGMTGYWSFCIAWMDQPVRSEKPKGAAKIDYKEVLTAPQFAVYSQLREVRKQLAERDGVPVYAVATNEQLAQMVRQPARSLTALQKVAGFGKAKVEMMICEANEKLTLPREGRRRGTSLRGGVISRSTEPLNPPKNIP
jgi:superfamily II DNA helicase RecQ